jgi:hypothetical protein
MEEIISESVSIIFASEAVGHRRMPVREQKRGSVRAVIQTV